MAKLVFAPVDLCIFLMKVKGNSISRSIISEWIILVQHLLTSIHLKKIRWLAQIVCIHYKCIIWTVSALVEGFQVMSCFTGSSRIPPFSYILGFTRRVLVHLGKIFAEESCTVWKPDSSGGFIVWESIQDFPYWTASCCSSSVSFVSGTHVSGCCIGCLTDANSLSY